MSIEGIFATDAAAQARSEDFITHVTHHAALPMQPQRRHFFCRDGDTVTFNYL